MRYFRLKRGDRVLVSLSMLLSRVAKDKQIKDKNAWVSKKLGHCEIQSDYCNTVKLSTSKHFWFGVQDREFEMGRLFAYFDFADESIIYAFRTLLDKQFHELITRAYYWDYDKIRDVRFYCDMQPVPFKVLLPLGKECVLGEFNNDAEMTLNTPLTFCPALYILYMGETILFYTASIDLLKLKLRDLRECFNVPLSEGRFSSDLVRLLYMGKRLQVVKVDLVEDLDFVISE